MITENLSTLKIHKLTNEQYERELAAGRIDLNALYLTPEEDNSGASEELVNEKIAEAINDYDDTVTTKIAEAINQYDNVVQDFVSAGIQYVENKINGTFPTVTTDDNGKFLRVVDGVWAAVAIPNVEDGEF